MKLFFALVMTFFSASALADNSSQIDVNSNVPASTSEVVGYDSALDQGAKQYSVEVSFQSVGDYGQQAYHTFSNASNRSSSYYQGTDGMIALTLRKYFTTEFDLSLSGTILNSVSSASANDTPPGNSYVNVSMKPISIGARYHLSYFSDSITPFAQVDLGEALISETSNYDPDNTSNVSYFRPFAKVAVGSDFFITPKAPVYVGVKLGYLVMSEFGGFTTGVDLGYAF